MIKNFESWLNENESSRDISDIFKNIHAPVNREVIIPFDRLFLMIDKNEKDKLQKVCDYLEVNTNYMFYDETNIISPIIYWNGPVFYQFHGKFNLENVKMFNAKQSIENLEKTMNNYIKSNNWTQLFSRAEKKIIIPLFIDLYNDIPDNKKYDIFIDIYVRSEYGFQLFPKNILKDLAKKRFLSSDWKLRMSELKNKTQNKSIITIYRGQSTKSSSKDDAYSWTLSKKTASFFADRFGKGRVVNKQIEINKIIDYLPDRGESEVLINFDI